MSINDRNLRQWAAVFAVLITAAVCTACEPEPATDYQAYMSAAAERAVFILNGHSESMSAYDPAGDIIYNNVQLVGHSSTNSAIPADIIVNGDDIHIILSGQNSIETYSSETLDYDDDGKHYFENGYNPMLFIPVDGTSWVFAPGFEADQVQPVNLAAPEDNYSFADCFEKVDLSAAANSETKAAVSTKNAVGDNKSRGSTGGAVLKNGSSSRLYLTNVRYDSSILLKSPYDEDSADLAEYPADSGKNVKAGGYFREATISIFSFNANALTNGASNAALSFSLVKELSLEDLFYIGVGSGSYFPGDGLNPQSAFIVDGLLNIVCTGTNGGSVRTYGSDEYLPEGFNVGDEKPGTNPDDGIIIVADISDPDNPVYLTHLTIGGSPSGFRNAFDSSRKIIYLAGVGGLQSYKYGSAAGNFEIKHSSSNLLLAGDNAATDYFSGLCYDEVDDRLYISSYSDDSLTWIDVTGSLSSPVYSKGDSRLTGDGPGALCIVENL